MKGAEGKKPVKYLILTSSGGGGHINAAQARKAELKTLRIDEKDIDIIDLMGLADGSANKGQAWVPTYSFFGLDPVFSGEENTKKWNQSQVAGTEEAVRMLENLVEMQPIAEQLQASEVRANLAKYLAENDVKAVFNTQALSTPAICQAVVDHNKDKTDDKLEIVTTVTDLITHRADHFLNSLKNLTAEQKEVLKMEIATAPMGDPGEEQGEFLEKYDISDQLFVPKAKLNKSVDGRVTRDNSEDSKKEYKLPVKNEYKEPESNKNKIIVKAGDEGQQNYLKEQLGDLVSVGNSDITIGKKKEDKLITITMGSQGSNSVIEYMDAFKDQVKNLPNDFKGNVYLCIAAGHVKGTLYPKTKEKADEILKLLPPEKRARVKILPLAFQDAKHMASLLNNSDVLITRSGGMSAMEAKQTDGRNPNRQVYVHSEAKLKYPDNFPKHSYDATYEALMTGTVKWEGGNAEYLLREIGASLGSPEIVDFGFKRKDKVNVKENSLFHFAYDKKLKEDNLAKIERLIREGSNPNLRFPGGSYLLDHCQDIETKSLLVRYGAELSKKAISGLSGDDISKLKDLHKIYKNQGSPKEPISKDYGEVDREKEEKARLYLDPRVAINSIEKTILAMDIAGEFIKNKILRLDSIRNSIKATKMYLRTDPTEKRSMVKRMKQFRNFLFDTVVFVGKQPANLIIKPLALTANIVKTGLIGLSMLVNEARGEKSNISNYIELKKAAKAMWGDFKDTAIAAGSAALVISGFGAPIAFTIGGVSASISFGIANFGPGNSIVSAMNQSLIQGVSYLGTPNAQSVLMAEGLAEWAVLRPYAYFALDPKKLYYEKNKNSYDKDKLNVVGNKIKELYDISSDPKLTIKNRMAANQEMEKMLKGQVINEVVAPALRTALTPFAENRKTSSEAEDRKR